MTTSFKCGGCHKIWTFQDAYQGMQDINFLCAVCEKDPKFKNMPYLTQPIIVSQPRKPEPEPTSPDRFYIPLSTELRATLGEALGNLLATQVINNATEADWRQVIELLTVENQTAHQWHSYHEAEAAKYWRKMTDTNKLVDLIEGEIDDRLNPMPF